MFCRRGHVPGRPNQSASGDIQGSRHRSFKQIKINHDPQSPEDRRESRKETRSFGAPSPIPRRVGATRTSPVRSLRGRSLRPESHSLEMEDQVVKDLESGSILRTAKDLFAGAAGGITQVLLGTFLLLPLQLWHQCSIRDINFCGYHL
jgi:hypothetical protein